MVPTCLPIFFSSLDIGGTALGNGLFCRRIETVALAASIWDSRYPRRRWALRYGPSAVPAPFPFIEATALSTPCAVQA